jgi:REP element-mobilizing transposase RayT
MARPLRVEFAGAIYHVTSRGNARSAIFRDDEDRQLLLSVLGKVVERLGWLVHAMCLMDNHYHLLIETPQGDLSRGMRQLNGIYTQRFNRRHAGVGHVFQGRFKAILIERESYLLELARYIVLNPVRARVVDHPARYRWSSYQATVGKTAKAPWLTTDWVLSQFAKTTAVARQRYARFVSEGKDLPSPWTELKGQVLLGSDTFAERMRPLLLEKEELKEIPRGQRLAHRPGLARLFRAAVCREKASRDAAIREACLQHGYTAAAVARAANVHYSTVSRVLKGER